MQQLGTDPNCPKGLGAKLRGGEDLLALVVAGFTNEAVVVVIVREALGLHEGVRRRGTKEAPTHRLQLFGQCRGAGGLGWDAANVGSLRLL